MGLCVYRHWREQVKEVHRRCPSKTVELDSHIAHNASTSTGLLSKGKLRNACSRGSPAEASPASWQWPGFRCLKPVALPDRWLTVSSQVSAMPDNFRRGP